MNRSPSARIGLLAVVLLLLSPMLALAQNTLPSMQEIQTDFDAHRYTDVVRKVQQVMALRTQAAASYDKAKLLQWRAESQLQLKQFVPASDSFAAAAKETKDSKELAIDTAMSLLIKRAPGGRYVPKQPTSQPAAGGTAARPGPIDIIEATSRKQALAALYNDESKASLPKIRSLSQQTTMPPLVEAIKLAGDLRSLEVAATGADAQSKTMVADLGERAGKLMADAVKTMSDEVEKIFRTANETLTDPNDPSVVPGQQVQKRGLTSTDMNTLRDVNNTCVQIASACDQLTAAIGGASKFDTVKTDAAALANRAIEVQQTDYNGNGGTPSPRRGGQTPPRGPYR